MKQHLELLGYKVKDAVTGFEGVVESISFDLYGCVQTIVRLPHDKKKGDAEGRWFDTKRLTKTSKAPVMPLPVFAQELPGGIEKPDRPSQPMR